MQVNQPREFNRDTQKSLNAEALFAELNGTHWTPAALRDYLTDKINESFPVGDRYIIQLVFKEKDQDSASVVVDVSTLDGRRKAILDELSDGKWHVQAEVAKKFGISQQHMWNDIDQFITWNKVIKKKQDKRVLIKLK